MSFSSKIPRNLSFRHLRAFVCVAHTESFTAAAKILAISQPALTLNIHQFEDIVGVELLTRTTRRVELTPLGKEFLPCVEKYLADFDNSILDLRAKAEQQDNQVDIALLPSVAIRILPSVIREFAQISRDTVINLHDNNGRGIQSQVLSNKADIGISNIWEEHPELEYTPFISDRVGLICHSSHPLAKVQQGLSWRDLSDQAFVGMTADTGIHRLFQENTELPQSVTAPSYSVLTISTLVGLLESGNSISALPALAAPDYLNPALVYRDLSSPVIFRQLYLITVRSRPLGRAAQTFRDFLLQQSQALCAGFPNKTVVSGS